MSKPPAYHQAFIARARAMWPTYQCPCGCAAKPTIEDLARDLWAQSIVGERPGSDRVLFSVPPRPERAPAPDPTDEQVCRVCGVRRALPDWLAAFIVSCGVRWACEVCR